MGRIRCIKPDFAQSESMGRVSREARLLFILLWTVVDDAGRTRASSRMLASLLYPYDDDVAGTRESSRMLANARESSTNLIDAWMAELEAENCLVRYVVDGSTYLQICNWARHQKIDRPSASKIPAFDESSRVLANPRRVLDADKDKDMEEEGDKEKDKEEDKPKATTQSKASSKPDDVSSQVWSDWIAHRKAKRATVSSTVVDSVRREAQRAGWTLEAALVEVVARGWQGFKAEWVLKQATGRSFGQVDYKAGVSDDGSL